MTSNKAFSHIYYLMVFVTLVRQYSSSPGTKSSILDIVARLGRPTPQSDLGISTRRTASKVVYPELDLEDDSIEVVGGERMVHDRIHTICRHQ